MFGDGRRVAKDAVFSYDEVRDMLENEELRRPCYLYELRFETLNKEAYVEFEQNSINNFTYELDPNMMPHVTFACQDFYDKGGRFLCRNSTRLPQLPMVDALFCLIFAPQVQVKADPKHLYFQKIICDAGETVIPLTHILTHQDLELIQKVRTMMNETLCNEDNQKQAHLAQCDFYIKRLFAFNRLPVNVFEKLMSLRDEDGDNGGVVVKTDEQGVKRDPFKAEKEQVADPFMKGEMNFFLQEEQAEVKEGAEYDEVDNIQEENDVTGLSQDTFVNAQELELRQRRYESDCALGYFL